MDTLTDSALEELFQLSIPCDGISSGGTGVQLMGCDRPATMRRVGHSCGAKFKCFDCFLEVHRHNEAIVGGGRMIECVLCGGLFGSAVEYADYRPM